MDWFALHFLLLMSLLLLNSAQTTAPYTSQTGCASHPVLCCSGQNNSCYRRCYCDEACVAFRDCCPDYNSTCAQPFTSALPNGLSTTNSRTSSTPVDGSTTTASTASTATDGGISAVSDQRPDPRSTMSTDEDVLTAIVHLKVSILTRVEKNEDVIVEALSSFVSQAQAVLQQSCEGCTLKIRQIKPT